MRLRHTTGDEQREACTRLRQWLPIGAEVTTIQRTPRSTIVLAVTPSPTHEPHIQEISGLVCKALDQPFDRNTGAVKGLDAQEIVCGLGRLLWGDVHAFTFNRL